VRQYRWRLGRLVQHRLPPKWDLVGAGTKAEINIYPNIIYDIGLSPTLDAHGGVPGEVVTYALVLTNLGNIDDAVALTIAVNLWSVNLPLVGFDLAPGESIDVIIGHLQWLARYCSLILFSLQ
jgi:hypothetical protein